MEMWKLAIVLGIVWLAGLTFSHTFGGYIHILPIVAIVLVILHYFQSKPKELYSRMKKLERPTTKQKVEQKTKR